MTLAILNILLAVIPQFPLVWQSIMRLKTKYPDMTDDEIIAKVLEITSASDATFDSIISRIEAERAARPKVTENK